LEDSTWNISPIKKLGEEIMHADIKKIQLKYSIYTDLEHMDVAQVSFIKGLQQFYNKPRAF
jgi:hypothetical protein